MYSRKMSSLTSYATVTKRFSSPNTMMGSTRNQVPAALDREGAPKHRNQQSISRFWDLVEEKNRIIIKSGYSVWEETNIYLQLMPSTGLGTKMGSTEFVHHLLIKGNPSVLSTSLTIECFSVIPYDFFCNAISSETYKASVVLFFQ